MLQQEPGENPTHQTACTSMNFQHHRVKGKMNSLEVILYYRLGSAHNNVLQGRGVEMALKVKFKKIEWI